MDVVTGSKVVGSEVVVLEVVVVVEVVGLEGVGGVLTAELVRLVRFLPAVGGW